MRIITDEKCAGYEHPGQHPERPARIRRTLERLTSQEEVRIDWSSPIKAEDDSIRRAHTAQLLKRFSHPVTFDADTPYHPDIEDYARMAAGAGLLAMEAARRGETVMSLMRPPGHHATADEMMGFCYLNTVAISVLEALSQGVNKVGIIDFDVHHGNGTEAILYEHPGCVFASIHQHPCYPGTGTHSNSNCYNFPVRPNTPRKEYRQTLTRALEKLQANDPEMIAVSAGFDAYVGDPLSEETLEAEDFQWFGEAIRQLKLPTFHILEGGYSDDLPELVLAYLKGLEGK